MQKKILCLLLALCVVFTMVPFVAFATEDDTPIDISSITDSEKPAVCENHKEHDAACGYVEGTEEIACDKECTDTDGDEVIGHVDGCAYTPAVVGSPCTHECSLCKTQSEQEEQCACTIPCTRADSENGMDALINADCPICGALDADLGNCKGVAPKMMPLSETGSVTLIVNASATENSPTRFEGAEYQTLAGAYAAALAGDTIRFESNSTISGFLRIEKNITIDLNGNTVTQTNTLRVMNAELTLMDSKSEGKLLNTSTGYDASVTTIQSGSFVLESGIIEGAAEIIVNINHLDCKFTMTGGTISSPAKTALYTGGTVNISGGTITTETGIALHNFGGIATISGGTIQATNGGTALSGFGYVFIAEGGSLTGQTIVVGEDSRFWLTGGALANVTVVPDSTAPSFNANLNCFLAPGATFDQGGVNGTATTYAGTLTATLAEVAEVGGVKFSTLQQAFDAAATGTTEQERTVKLLMDIDMGKANVRVSSGDIILDLGEYTITNSKVSDYEQSSVIYIIAGNFTCKATTGGITSSGTSPLYFSSIGNLTIDGGTFSGKPIYARRMSGSLGDITINNGTFDGFDVACRKSLTIYDGSFGKAGSTALFVHSTPVVIHNGSFEATSSNTVALWHSQATIKGGTFTCTSQTENRNNVLDIIGSGVCTIEGGTFNLAKIYIGNTANALKLQGGSFTNGIRIQNDRNTSPLATLANILQSGYGYIDGSGNGVSVTGGVYGGHLQVQRIYNITGTIKGSDTENGLIGATVQLKKGTDNAGSSVATNASGRFTIAGVPNGNYTLEVSKSGYTNGTISEFTVSDNDVINKDLTLQKIYTPITAVSVSNASPKVGDTLTATLTPANATVSYQWKADGAEIIGATNNTYTVHESDVGKAITVTVTGSGDFNGNITSDATSKIIAVVTTGDGQSITNGATPSQGIQFTFNGDHSMLATTDTVMINDVTVDPINYTITKGSTIVTLKKAYLDTLSAGTYTLKVNYQGDVSASSTFTIASAPAGGGSSNDDGYDFWVNVKDIIKDAKVGDTIKVKAYGYDKMPWSVMQALYNSKVNMFIEWSYGKDIYIAVGNAVNPSIDVGRVYYPLSYLEKLFEGKQADTSDAQNVILNPETGGIIEVVANNSNPVESIEKPMIKTPAGTGVATNANEMLLSATPNVTHQNSKGIIPILLAILVSLGGGYWYCKKHNILAK